MNETYINDPDDGHEHDYVDAEGTSVENAIVCTKCGELSVDDENEEE